MQKARLPSPSDHPSYHQHRRQLWTQILGPLLVAVAVIVALSALAGMAVSSGNNDLGRWAAISTMWVVIPFMFAGVIFLAVFGGLIYLMARLIHVIPPYTGKAQRFVWRVEGAIKRGADAVVRPILGIEGVTATIKSLFRIK